MNVPVYHVKTNKSAITELMDTNVIVCQVIPELTVKLVRTKYILNICLTIINVLQHFKDSITFLTLRKAKVLNYFFFVSEFNIKSLYSR